MGGELEKSLGRKIAHYRRAARITQELLAERTGIVPDSISRLERGVTVTSVRTLAKISEILDVGLHNIFDFRSGDSPKDEALDSLVTELRRGSEDEIRLIHDLTRRILGFYSGKNR